MFNHLHLKFLGVIFIIGFSFGKKQAELKIKTEFKPDDCSTIADDGDQVFVHYTGYLDSGVIFDSSIQAQREPLAFVLGQRRVIPGWEMGIKGMCVGEKRKLIIPSHLAYGKQGSPPTIPPDATLTFDTELISLNKPTFNFPIVQTVQLCIVPAFILYVIYYLYERYKKETMESKELKRNKKRK